MIFFGSGGFLGMNTCCKIAGSSCYEISEELLHYKDLVLEQGSLILHGRVKQSYVILV